ncbi:MAG TPA: tol-pal system-associated acyl-CoA thioesterase [Steroidobacteraceae bacterium]|nr:tol-pal system-associated acyl-CoA thioesterase [Steroidobacteraceae bacterium]
MNLRPNFSWVCRVYWEDTDAGGVVYYANYLKFMERCRTEWLRSLGIDQRRLREERGLQFAVVGMTVEYLRAARLDDEIAVTAELQRLGGATIEFQQTIRRGDLLLTDAGVRVACVDAAKSTACAIPKDLFAEWRR